VTYEPREYWPSHGPLRRKAGHAAQEEALLAAMGRIQVKSILEIGVGNGRIGKLLCERWPNATYAGVDISTDRLDEARENLPESARLYHADLLEWDTDERFDLVVAAEVLMHVRPEDIEAAVARLKGWSTRHIYTADWTEPITKAITVRDYRHDYEALGLTKVATTGLQGIHHAKV
jgi:trans-aconitate methyltransferase